MVGLTDDVWVDSLQKDGRVDWGDIKWSTLSKALSMLEDLEFVERKAGYIRIMPKTFEFVSHPDKRSFLFAEGALRIPAFKIFVEILETHKDIGLNLSEIGNELRKRLDVDWKDSTAEVNAKIMMNWARHAGLAPSVFANTQKGSARGTGERTPTQTTLFDNSTNNNREAVN